MKYFSKIKDFLSPTFFQQLFLYSLLVGLIPCAMILAEALAPNLPSLNDIIPLNEIRTDGIEDTFNKGLKKIEENTSVEKINTDGISDKINQSKEELKDMISNSFIQGVKLGIKTFIDGFQLTKAIRQFLLFLYVLCLFLSVYWCIKEKIKKNIFLLGQGFIFAMASYLAIENVHQLPQIFSVLILFLYPIFSLAAIIYFVRNGHVRSNSFFWATATMAAIFGIPSAFLFAIAGILLRFPYLVIQQNIEIIKPLKFRRLVFIFIKSFIYWLPLLLFVIPGNKLSNSIYEGSINGIYTHIFDRNDGERGLEKKYFIEDVNKFLDDKFAPLEGPQLNAHFDSINKSIDDNFESISAEVGHKSDQLPKAISKRYQKEMMKGFIKIAPYFAQEECGFHIIVPTSCCIMNGTKSFLWTKCIELGIELGKAIEKDLAAAMKASGKDGIEGLEENKKLIKEKLAANKKAFETKVAALKSSLKSSIMNLYNSIVLFNLFMDILLFFLIVKSFMVVFARVAFSGQDDIYVTLLEADKRMAKGDIKKCGSQYTILSSNTKDFYTSRLYEPSGRPPKYTIPQKFSVIFGRLRTRNYALNHVVMRNRTGSVYYNALGGTQFVEWTLKPSEEVIFSLDNFVAMSEEVTLSTTYSFRLTSLLLGRFRFTTAKGPGKLVLLTKGEPITSDQRKGSASVPVSRVIAFQKNTRFHVHSELNFIDVFMSSIYLQKKPGDLIVIDADEKGSARSGISKFIKGFLLPV